tara:strand:+ start:1061 stop:1240 length:180 start_codon:yes stop_codon:yes gene_type:complete
MQFHELNIGDYFTIGDQKYLKCKVQKISCCRLKRNAVTFPQDEDVIIEKNDEVEKADNE